MDHNRHITSRDAVTDEDVEQLPLIVEELKERRPRRSSPGVDYMTQHSFLREIFGSAREHRCVDCKKPALHWSLSTMDNARLDPYFGYSWSPEISDYLPRCSGCHQRHDGAVRRTSKVA